MANPIVTDSNNGHWEVEIRYVGKSADQLGKPPSRTYSGGKGWSLFTGSEIPSDYIKAMAQQGRMDHVLYAVVTKPTKLMFRAPEPADFQSLEA